MGVGRGENTEQASQKRALLARRVGEDPTLRNREIERQRRAVRKSAMHAGQARGWLVGPDHLNSPPLPNHFGWSYWGAYGTFMCQYKVRKYMRLPKCEN